MQTTTRRVVATFALRALLAAGAIGCAAEQPPHTVEAEDGTRVPASYYAEPAEARIIHAASCADALESPTDGNRRAYHRAMLEAGWRPDGAGAYFARVR